MQPPNIDGYAVDRLVGFGATGQIWRARELASGEWVALKRLRPEAIAVLERLCREAEVMSSLGSPHLVAVRAVVEHVAEVFVVSDFVAGDSLETLLARRDRLTTAEAITVFAPIADVLADVHEAGLVHGGLSAANLLIGPDGRPMLTDCGIGLALDGRAAEPHDDVAALGALAFASLDDDAGALVEVLSRATERSSTASELAAAILAVGPAAPIRATGSRKLTIDAPLLVGGPTPPPRRPPPETERRPRRLPIDRPTPIQPRSRRRPAIGRRVGVVVAVIAVVLVGAAIAGTLLGHHHAAAVVRQAGSIPLPTATPTASVRFDGPEGFVNARPSDWRDVVMRLETARVRAFDRADAELLDEVYVAGSPGLAVDRETIDSLRHRRLRARGFTATVRAVRPLEATKTSATVAVTDRLSGYELVDPNGTINSRGNPRPTRTYEMTLIKTAKGWRVESVSGQNIESSAPSRSG